MSGVNQFISIGTEDPEYYAELLFSIRRPADRRLPFSSCPDIPGIQDVHDPLVQRLQTLLNSIADISLCQRGNVSATMACLKDSNGTLETLLYIVFNHERDQAARRCSQHLQDIFNMLRRVPYKPPAIGGSKVIANEFHNYFLDICTVIHNYSFDIFAYRVNKRRLELPAIQEYIKHDQPFNPVQRHELLTFLGHVESIISVVAAARATKKLPTTFIEMLLSIRSYWKEHDLLPGDSLDSNKLTLLDLADAWLAEEHKVGFRLRRWAMKIMSISISADRLFFLTQSRRLHRIIQGNFSVQILASPATVPYQCSLSSETVRVALDAALANTRHLSADSEMERETFIASVLEKRKVPNVSCPKPTVHAELAMIMAMVKGEVKDVLPYVGVSKPSCIMCSQYICAFDDVMGQKIGIKGSHGKAYPGWFWPCLPRRDKDLRQAFLRRIREQLLSDFERHAETLRRHSDSTVGSEGPEWEEQGLSNDKILDFMTMALRDLALQTRSM